MLKKIPYNTSRIWLRDFSSQFQRTIFSQLKKHLKIIESAQNLATMRLTRIVLTLFMFNSYIPNASAEEHENGRGLRGGGGGPGGPGGAAGAGEGPGGPPPPPPPPPPPLVVYSVRSVDGSREDVRGMAGAMLTRLATAEYPDGVGNSMAQFPNARRISNIVADNGSQNELTQVASDMLWSWGQFIDHDIDLSETGDSESVTITVMNCSPTDIICTIPFSRSEYTEYMGVRQQINKITSFLDASMVYGSDRARANELRTFQGGRLKMGANNLLPFNVNELENAALDSNVAKDLFLAGDVRANEQIGLTVMHTLFMREHNRLVDALAVAFPGTSDENLYQMGRKIVGAEIQRITYNEFLPVLLGPSYAPKLNEYPGYAPSENPGIVNEFATVAFRMGHTMLSPSFSMGRASPISLADAFFNPDILVNTPTNVDHLLAGLTQQRAQAVDTQVIDEVRNFLFGSPVAKVGLDLVALNIQRGRDHGIPRYNGLRAALGLGTASSFTDIAPNDAAIRLALATAYDNDVDMVDAWIGGLAETHVSGGMVGELFATIIADQFRRLMVGDKFFYLNDPELTDRFQVLKDRNVIDLRTVKLSDIIARNTRLPINHSDDVMVVVPP